MKGIGVLMKLSALSRSDYAHSCVDLDRNAVDLERLENFGWSSGEQVLVDLVREIYNGSGKGSVADLTALDEDNRRVAIMALESWLVEGQASA
jgi:hypothetical protein